MHKKDLVSGKGTMYIDQPKRENVKFTPYKQQFESIMKNFDFEKVHKVMVFLNWTWVTKDGIHLEVPSLENIKEEAGRLLWSCYLEPNDPWTVACGGFKVEKNGGRLSLQFVLEEWDLYDYEPDEIEGIDNGQA